MANYHSRVFKITKHVFCYPLQYKISIQGSNLTVPIYILFSTELKTSSISTFEIFDKRHKSLHLAYRSIACAKLKLIVYNPKVLNKYTEN